MTQMKVAVDKDNKINIPIIHILNGDGRLSMADT